MIIVDKETFEAEVQQSSMPCVVDLWGPQCGPCLALMPEVEKLAEAYEGKLKFCKLNVAENRRLVISLRVMAVPTILFYKGGECVARISGDAVSIEAIKAEYGLRSLGCSRSSTLFVCTHYFYHVISIGSNPFFGRSGRGD